MIDIELVNTDKPVTGIRKRSISNDIQRTNPDFKALVNFLMKADKENFYSNKQLLIDLMDSAVERAFIEGQQAGTKHIEYIQGENNGRERAAEVYPDNGFTLKD